MMDQQLFGDASGPYAKVIADSESETGHRLTTMEVQCHRFVLAEFNTHRKFSRNSASSRAIPVAKQIERLENNAAYPLQWASEQKGMQGGDEIPLSHIPQAVYLWEEARDNAIDAAEQLVSLGVHKSIVNRLLEPFMWHKIIVSSTEWENFFSQRCSPLAQPEIRAVAEHMQMALHNSVPQQLTNEMWHTPYFDWDGMDIYDLADWCDINLDGFPTASNVLRSQALRFYARWVSAARCARVSYLTHDGQRDIEKDIALYKRLVEARPAHWSPLEHVATPRFFLNVPQIGNFDGWMQMREFEEGRAA